MNASTDAVKYAPSDAHLEPTPFREHGTLAFVIDRLLQAIAQEAHLDVLAIPSKGVTFGPSIGAMRVDGVEALTRKPVVKVTSYTRRALNQLAARTHSDGDVTPSIAHLPTVAKDASYVERAAGKASTEAFQAEHSTKPAKLADVALWASPTTRALILTELIATGANKGTERTFRTVRDAHNPNPAAQGQRLTRAIVSARHSGASGDDVVYLGELNRFALKETFATEFATGQARVTRDPAGETEMIVDSAKRLAGDARLTMRFSNNEIGGGSAQVGLSLTFEITPETSYTLAIPGTNSSATCNHLGGKPADMFASFGEKLAMVLMWAPTAVSALRNTSLEAKRFEAIAARICKGLERYDLTNRQREIENFVASIVNVAPRGSVLSAILTILHFHTDDSTHSLVTEFAGQP